MFNTAKDASFKHKLRDNGHNCYRTSSTFPACQKHVLFVDCFRKISTMAAQRNQRKVGQENDEVYACIDSEYESESQPESSDIDSESDDDYQPNVFHAQAPISSCVARQSRAGKNKP